MNITNQIKSRLGLGGHSPLLANYIAKQLCLFALFFTWSLGAWADYDLTHSGVTIGAIDQSTEFGKAQTEATTIKLGETKKFAFTNHGNSEKTWFNWCVVIDDDADFSDYNLVMRADNWAWGDALYPTQTDGEWKGHATTSSVDWNNFATDMQNAEVQVKVVYNDNKTFTITAEAKANGRTHSEELITKAVADGAEKNIYFIVEKSHLTNYREIHTTNDISFTKADESTTTPTIADGLTKTSKTLVFETADAGNQCVIKVNNLSNSTITTLWSGDLPWYYQSQKLYITAPAEGKEGCVVLQAQAEDGALTEKYVIHVKTKASAEPSFSGLKFYATTNTASFGNGSHTTISGISIPNSDALTAPQMADNSAMENFSAIIKSYQYDWDEGITPLKATYKVEENKKFIPSEIRIPVLSVSTTKSFRVTMADNNGHKIQQDIHSVYDDALMYLVVQNKDGVAFMGDVTLSILCYAGSEGFRIANPISVSGTVESIQQESSDTSLKSLTYNGLVIPLEENTISYEAKAISGISPVVEALPTDADASVKITYPQGFSDPQTTEGTVEILVTAANKTTQTYRIHFTASAETPVSEVKWNFYKNPANNGQWNVAADSDGNLYRLNYTLNVNGDAINENGLFFRGASQNGNGGRTVSFSGIKSEEGKYGRIAIEEQKHCQQFNVRLSAGDPLAVGYHSADYTQTKSTAFESEKSATYYIDFSSQVRIRSITWMPESVVLPHSVKVSASEYGSASFAYDSETGKNEASVMEGKKVTFTAVANENCDFVSWTDTEGNVVANTATYIIYNLYGPTELKANFVQSEQKTQLQASFANNILGNVGDMGIDMPQLTVTAKGQVLAENAYTVSYQNSNPEAVQLSSGKINLLSSCNAVVTATITPTDAAAYEVTTATFTVTSTALVEPVVDVQNVNMSQNAKEQAMPKVSVYAAVNDQNVLLTLGVDYNISYSVKTSGGNLTVNGSSITVSGSAGNYQTGDNVLIVTIVPTSAGVNDYNIKQVQKDFNFNVTPAEQKHQAEVKVSANISYQVNTAKDVSVSIVYDGHDITDLFENFTYTLSTTEYGTVKGSKNVFTFTPGSQTAEDIVLTIKADPIEAYKDQYESVTGTSTLKIVDNALVIEATLSANTVEIGKQISFTSVVVKDKKTQEIFDYEAGECTLEYVSSSPAVLAIDAKTGKMTPLSEGETEVKIIARKDNYASASWIKDVTVTDPSVYRAAADKGVEAPANGTVITSVDGIAMTYGGWVFNDVTRQVKNSKGQTATEYFGQKNDGKSRYGWGASGADGAGSLPKFKYSFMGNSHQNPRDEMGANSLPENYANVAYDANNKPIDPMFNVPTEGAYITFAPKSDGTVVAHVLQEGAFSGTYDSSKSDESKKNSLVYRRDRRVLIVDEMGQRITDVKATLDVATGKMPKDVGAEGRPSMTKVTLYSKLDGTKLTTDYDYSADFVGFNNTDFEYDDEGNITNFKNGIYKFYGTNASDPYYGTGDGWGVLVKAPVTYEFKVKAGKTYYLYNYGSKINVFGFSFKADENITVDKLTFKEREANTVKRTAAGHVAQVSLDRKFSVGKWNACVLPFSLNKQQVDAIFGQTYDKDHTDGTEILYFEKVVGNTIYYTRHAYNTIVAGKPFLIRPSGKNTDGTDVATLTEGSIVLNTAKVTDFPYVTIENTKPAAWGRADSEGYYWASDYQVQTIQPGDYYINGEGSLIMRQQSNANMQSFRGYLKQKSSVQQAKALRVAYYDMFSSDSDVPSGIDNLMVDTDGRFVEMPSTGCVYNLSGQMVNSDASTLRSLPKGIYVVNGKKYVVE